MSQSSSTPRKSLVVLGTAWVALGLVVAPAIAIVRPATVVNDELGLAVVLGVIATILANIKFQLSPQPGAPVYCPVGAPIVLAAVTCTPIQAMLVTLVATLLSWSALRDAVAGVEIREWLASAGLATMSVPFVSAMLQGADRYLDAPLGALLVGFAATCAYLVVDALAFMVWMQAAAGAGRDVLAHFRSVAPLDIGLTGTSVILAVPFHDQPLLVAAVLGVWQAGIVGYYRMSTSEHVHRRQASYLRDVFARYVPESVAERLVGMEDEVRLGGETRMLSILFCDIRGFTAWSEQHDAETVIQQLNVVLSAMTEAVMEHEGTLDKFTGDGLMAFWGAPLSQPGHASLACRAALEIHDALARCNAKREALGMPPFEIGIGIASGSAVVGNIGHDRRLDYTVIGDTVNLSARLEASTKELGVPTVLSAATVELLEPELAARVTPLGLVTVKGKVDSVAVYGLAGIGREGSSSVDESGSEMLA